MTERIYWDSCCFIALISVEPQRHAPCRAIYEAAEKGEIELVTSALTLAEVCRVRCEPKGSPRSELERQHDIWLERFFDNDFFQLVEVTPCIATMARNLYRAHTSLGKPNDALHLATALDADCDQMHTYDHNDLISLSGQIQRRDGRLIIIGPPPPPPPSLFDMIDKPK